MQKRAASGFSWPQRGHVTMGESLRSAVRCRLAIREEPAHGAGPFPARTVLGGELDLYRLGGHLAGDHLGAGLDQLERTLFYP